MSPRTGTPILTGIAVSALAIGVLLINLGNPAAFAAITSTSVVVVYLAYLLVTVPALRARLRHHPRLLPQQAGGFSLGRWGLPVNVLAVVYGAVMMVNIAWPRQEVYDPAGTSWMLQYLALLFVTTLVVVGLVVHRVLRGRPAPGPVAAVAAVAEG